VQRYKFIPIIAVLMFGVGMATAQHDGRRQSPPRYSPPPSQSQAPQQQTQRGDQNSGRQNPDGQPQMQQRQGDGRFILRGPGPHAGDWLRRHEDEPVDKQLKALENDPTFKQLTPDGQQQFRNRLNRFNSLPPQQRDRMLNNLDIIEHLTPQQEQRVRGMFGDFRQLPEGRRRDLTSALRQLQEMSPEDRQRTIDSEEYRRNYSDKERDLLRGMSDLGISPTRGRGYPRD
jgi:phage-related protein